MTNFVAERIANRAEYLSRPWGLIKHWEYLSISSGVLSHMYSCMGMIEYNYGHWFSSDLPDGFYSCDERSVLAVYLRRAIGMEHTSGHWCNVRRAGYSKNDSVAVCDRCKLSELRQYDNWTTAIGIAIAFEKFYVLDHDNNGNIGVRGSRAYRLRIGETNPRKMLPDPRRDNAIVSQKKKLTKKCEFPDCPIVDGLEAHHLWPLYKGGADVMENLVVLCESHHLYMHNSEHEDARMQRLANHLNKELPQLSDPRYLRDPKSNVILRRDA